MTQKPIVAEDMKKKELIAEIANQLYRFNIENEKWQVSDTFMVDGKQYSIQKEVFAWLKRKGFVNLVKLLKK